MNEWKAKCNLELLSHPFNSITKESNSQLLQQLRCLWDKAPVLRERWKRAVVDRMGGGVSGWSRQTVVLHAAAFLCPPASSASQEETVMDPRSLFIAGDRPTLALLSPLGGRPPRPVALRAHMWLCSWRGAGKKSGEGERQRLGGV